MKNELCSVCNEGIPEQYGHWNWDLQGQQYKLVLCPSCGCAFTSPMPDNDMLNCLYQAHFDYRWYDDHFQAKVRDCIIRLSEYEGLLGKRVLDFGGGRGYFSQVAREAGYKSATYDPYAGSGELEEKEWDTIVSLHMLEHANDLDATISLMKGFLAEGGNLVLAVPNFHCKGFKELGMKWVWAQPPLLHLYHFTADGLSKLLTRHGFTKIRVSYHERWDANLYADLEKVDKYRKLDAAWSRPIFNRFSVYRKLVARRNAAARFKGLTKAMSGYNTSNNDYAELQLVATKLVI